MLPPGLPLRVLSEEPLEVRQDTTQNINTGYRHFRAFLREPEIQNRINQCIDHHPSPFTNIGEDTVEFVLIPDLGMGVSLNSEIFELDQTGTRQTVRRFTG